jgi:hypothetical protein
LPRPVDYLFLYFSWFYALLLVFKVNPLKAFFGALAFGFSTYLIIILELDTMQKLMQLPICHWLSLDLFWFSEKDTFMEEY